MLELFAWGEKLFQMLMNIGDFLLKKPFVAGSEYFAFIADVLEFWQIGDFLGPADSVVQFFDMLGEQSIGSVLFGLSVSFLLMYRLVKFLLILFFNLV